MKVLVTGGAGFIGSHVVDHLIANNYEVVVVDDLSTGKKVNLHKNAKFYELDILSPELKNIFEKEKIDLVCHLAAATNVRKSIMNPMNDAKVNVLCAINLLENCVKFGIKKFVFSSTGGAIYGDAGVVPTPEDYPARPISPYGINKLAVEQYLYYYNTIHKLPVTVLRYSNVYGPRQDRKGEGGVVAVFIKKLMENDKPVINGTGEQTRDFIYVEDVAAANVKALARSAPELGTYNIGTEKETSIKNLLEIIEEKLGLNIGPVFGPQNKGEIIRSFLNAGKAGAGLLWEPKYNLEQGIDKTIKYFMEEYKN